MRVLLTGASGFIGRHLAAALTANGHAVVCAGRQASRRRAPAGSADHHSPARPGGPFPNRDAVAYCASFVDADFTRDTDSARWLPRLEGIDAVINAVGILRERGSQTFASLHVQAPRALFDACVAAGIDRVVNISALGADANARSDYHLSKRQADQHLAGLPLRWTIVQPSLVYGAGGESARLFTMLAGLPWIPLPGRGDQRVQPIHIDDLTAGILALLDNPGSYRAVVPFVGPAALTLRDFLAELRAAMRLGAARFIAVPLGLVRIAARLGAVMPHSLLDRQSLDMLLRGNVGDPGMIRSLLQREPRRPGQFISAGEAASVRTSAQLAWLLPLLRWSIALVWIVTGIVSLGLYPTASSYELLARVGVPGALAPLFLYGAAAFDLALGIATLVMRRRQYLWLAQIGLILFYTVVISVRMPEFWLHPYGPLLKNLPMLAAILSLYVLEKR